MTFSRRSYKCPDAREKTFSVASSFFTTALSFLSLAFSSSFPNNELQIEPFSSDASSSSSDSRFTSSMPSFRATFRYVSSPTKLLITTFVTAVLFHVPSLWLASMVNCPAMSKILSPRLPGFSPNRQIPGFPFN